MENPNVDMPEFVHHPSQGLFKVIGYAQKGGLDKAPYHGIDIKGKHNHNLFQETVKPVSRKEIEEFLK